MTTLRRMGKCFLANYEKIIFYFVLIVNLVFLFCTKFYPSIDGPAHIYNSNLIKFILLKNEFINQFYTINCFPVPNWMSHVLLTFLKFFLPGWLSEKLLVIIYVSGMALSFRYLVKCLQPKNMALSVLIFPFIYSYLFHLGFYNYSLSFIFLFVTLAYWVNNYKANQFSLYLVTGSLLLCAYFSNILTYAFLGITLGGIILIFETEFNPLFSKQYFLGCIHRIKRLMICSLPSLILFCWFFIAVPLTRSDHAYTPSELFKWINDVRCLIVFGYQSEEVITTHFFHVLLMLLFFSLFFNKVRFTLKEKMRNTCRTIACFPWLLTIIFLFLIPDGSNAEMMSDRLCLIFYIFFIILVVAQTIPKKVQIIFSLIIISLHLTLLTRHHESIRELNAHAKTIYETSKHLESNKVILPVNITDNWLELHFSNYLGADKPEVILENYEAAVGWFPIHWNPISPNIVLGEKNTVDNRNWYNSNNKEVKQIDYIFIYGNTTKKDIDNLKELNEIISRDFTLKYESEDKYTQLYKRNSQVIDLVP